MNVFWTAFWEILLIGIGLAMDAFAVSICNGLSICNLNKKKALIIAITFGLMQGIMPLIGYFIGNIFYVYIRDFDHWVAFILLSLIGGKMLFDGIKALAKPEQTKPKMFSYKEVFLQGIATSIDALIIGVTLCSMTMGLVANNFDWSIFVETGIIALVTFIISAIGIFLGGGINHLLKGKFAIAEIIGGVILIGIGIKTILDHLVFNTAVDMMPIFDSIGIYISTIIH
ncbi:MAG: manganese efflux pump [Erysipelotrichaceae bacterium]|nr:manganese efflux pump [Erysipelotrichaceae bacterium]